MKVLLHGKYGKNCHFFIENSDADKKFFVKLIIILFNCIFLCYNNVIIVENRRSLLYGNAE